MISVADGTSTPLDLGPAQSLNTIGWLDDQTVLVLAWTHNRPEETRYLAVPIDAPGEYTTLSLPSEATASDRRFFAPDLSRAAYVIEGGGFGLTELAGGESIHAATETGPVGWVGWAPDGASVVFMTDELDDSGGVLGNSTWLVGVDGTGLRLLAQDGVQIIGDPWQPVPGG